VTGDYDETHAHVAGVSLAPALSVVVLKPEWPRSSPTRESRMALLRGREGGPGAFT
jgi:hypothetical protein